MGWQERDYARTPVPRGPQLFRQRGFGSPWGVHTVVFWLLAINIAVYVIDGLLARFVGLVPFQTQNQTFGMPPLFAYGYFSAQKAIFEFQVWRFLTFQFLHGSIGHLFGNMLGIFFFGPIIERYLGSRRFLAFYLLCGFAGGVSYLLLCAIGLVISATWVPLIGASAGVFGILIGAARVAPDVRVFVFFLIPMKLRTLAWIIVGIAAYTVIAQGHLMGANAGGQAAHLGGAALGFLLIQYPRLLNFVDSIGLGLPGKIGKGRQRRRMHNLDTEVDRILAKVKEKGMHTLTEQEKQTLQRATDDQRRAG